jgi:MobA-like NTP transferase domain
MTATSTSEKIAAVALAAGRSERLGRPKQLLEVAGEALVRRATRAALGCGADETLVVTGACSAVLVVLADQPHVGPDVLARVVTEGSRTSEPLIGVVVSPTGESEHLEIQTITLDPARTDPRLVAFRKGNFLWHIDGRARRPAGEGHATHGPRGR